MTNGGCHGDTDLREGTGWGNESGELWEDYHHGGDRAFKDEATKGSEGVMRGVGEATVMCNREYPR